MQGQWDLLRPHKDALNGLGLRSLSSAFCSQHDDYTSSRSRYDGGPDNGDAGGSAVVSVLERCWSSSFSLSAAGTGRGSRSSSVVAVGWFPWGRGIGRTR